MTFLFRKQIKTCFIPVKKLNGCGRPGVGQVRLSAYDYLKVHDEHYDD
jgi:hypothetical protein